MTKNAKGVFVFYCGNIKISKIKYELLKGGSDTDTGIYQESLVNFELQIHDLFWPIKSVPDSHDRCPEERSRNRTYVSVNHYSPPKYETNLEKLIAYLGEKYPVDYHFLTVKAAYNDFMTSDETSNVLIETDSGGFGDYPDWYSTPYRSSSSYELKIKGRCLIIENILRYQDFQDKELYDILNCMMINIIIKDKCVLYDNPMINNNESTPSLVSSTSNVNRLDPIKRPVSKYLSAPQSAVAFNNPLILECIFNKLDDNCLIIPGELQKYFLCVIFQKFKFSKKVMNQNTDSSKIIKLLEDRYRAETGESFIPDDFYILLRDISLEVYKIFSKLIDNQEVINDDFLSNNPKERHYIKDAEIFKLTLDNSENLYTKSKRLIDNRNECRLKITQTHMGYNGETHPMQMINSFIDCGTSLE